MAGQGLAKLQFLYESCVDAKAVEPAALDLRNLSALTEFLLIMTGRSTPHRKSLGTSLKKASSPFISEPMRTSGSADDGWLILDLGDLMVHIFSPELREFYDLEGLWGDAPHIQI